MNYYEFDNHFWLPQTVCSPSSEQPQPNQKNARSQIFLGILTVLCICIWTPLLYQILVAVTNTNWETNLLTPSNSNDRILEQKQLLFYRSVQR